MIAKGLYFPKQLRFYSYLVSAQNAWDMLSDEQSQIHITTGSGDLNGILGGGIHCKEVTEIG